MGRPPTGKVAMTDAERMRRYRLKRSKNNPVTKPAGSGTAALEQELVAAKQELAAAKARIAEMHHERLAQAQAFRDESKRRAAKPKAEKPALPPDEVRDRRIKALTTEVRNLKAHILHMLENQAGRLAMAGGLPKATERAIDKVLHPDTRDHATEAAKDNASKLWNAWKDTRKQAR